jgi:HNH endonuclease
MGHEIKRIALNESSRFWLGIQLRKDDLQNLSYAEPIVLSKETTRLVLFGPRPKTDALEGRKYDLKGDFWCLRNKLWCFRDCLYSVDERYTQEQARLLILERGEKEQKKLERLRLKFDSEASREIKYCRPTIPEEIRVAVWRRDEGKCVRCDSRENLEYDHIIPVSKGGSNTARNIELLCEKCNREKGGRIQ